MSQAELAARAGLSTKHVNQIMQGHGADHLGDGDRLGAHYRDAGELLEPTRGRLPRGPPSGQAHNARPKTTRHGSSRSRSRSCRSATIPDREGPWPTLRRRLVASSASRTAPRTNGSGVDPVASFRRSQAFSSQPGAVVSWLRIAQIEAQPAKVERSRHRCFGRCSTRSAR